MSQNLKKLRLSNEIFWYNPVLIRVNLTLNSMLETLDKKPLATESGLDDKSDPIHIAHPNHCVRHML